MRDICATFVGHDSAEIFRLMVSKMSVNQKAASQANNDETKKIENFYNQFVRLHKMSAEVAAKELKAFSASDMQALAAHCVVHFNKFSYMTGVTKERVVSLAELLPQEIFAQVWSQVNGDLKLKMGGHCSATGKPDYFKKFEGVK